MLGLLVLYFEMVLKLIIIKPNMTRSEPILAELKWIFHFKRKQVHMTFAHILYTLIRLFVIIKAKLVGYFPVFYSKFNKLALEIKTPLSQAWVSSNLECFNQILTLFT